MPKKNTRQTRTKKTSKPSKVAPQKQPYTQRVQHWVTHTKQRIADYRKQRPHHSFTLTRRRDYKRQLAVPGYFALTIEVGMFIRQHAKLFMGLITLYALIVIVLGGLTSQATYVELQNTVSAGVTTDYGEIVGKAGQAAMTLLSSISVTGNLGEVQQLYLAIALLLIWMCAVWLARELMAGHAPKLRDGLYNSGAPFISTLLLGVVCLLQLVPIGILALVYSALNGIGLVSSGFGAMLFGVSALIVISLTMYWLTSTFIALVIVTLPGMYPMQALRLASQIVLSRRLRVLFRIIWALLMVAGVWLLVFVPLILLESWLRGMWDWLNYVPTIPMLMVFFSALTTVYMSLYIYIFYRRLVSDDSVPGR